MKYAAILAALAMMVLVPGCGSNRDEPVRVTINNPPAPAPVIVTEPQPTVIVREETVTGPQRSGTSPTATPAAPPIHGQRYRVDTVDVIYSEPMRAYTVVGHDDCYYSNGRFYRYDRTGWHYAPHLHGDTQWIAVREREVPETLVVLHRR